MMSYYIIIMTCCTVVIVAETVRVYNNINNNNNKDLIFQAHVHYGPSKFNVVYLLYTSNRVLSYIQLRIKVLQTACIQLATV